MTLKPNPVLLHRRQAFFPGPSDPTWQVFRVAHETWSPAVPVWRPHYGNCFIALVLAGSATLRTDGRPAQLHPGQVFCELPGHGHELIVERLLTMRLLVGRGERLAEAVRAISTSSPVVWTPQRTAAIESLLSELLEIAEEAGPAAQQAGDDGVRVVLSLLAHATRHQPPASTGSERTFADCRQLIEREALDLPDIATAAARCGIDRAYLSRLFRAYLGESPSAFLTRLKMRHAAELLAAGQSVADTAAACGYSDADVFSKAFRRHYGLPPSRWQAQSG